jgi:cytochrome c peroxidase
VACGDAPDSGSAAAQEARAARAAQAGWRDGQLALLESLWIGSLGPVPASASNRQASDPRAARLGHALFFDAGLSSNGRVSCASCHQPARHFTDGVPRSVGIGVAGRNAPTIAGAAHAPWQFWDGRRDSLWSQALAPMESAVEMGSTRLEVARHVTTDPSYRPAYAALFGEPPDFSTQAGWPGRAGPFGDDQARAAWQHLPEDRREQVNRAFANVGKAIEAYERRIEPGPSRFDRYVEWLLTGREPEGATLDQREVAGLRLFADVGRTLCLRCHNGPLFTNQAFHNVGTARLAGIDFGRFLGIESLLLDPFNCLGPYSDAGPGECGEIEFLDRNRSGELTGAFKTPTLRNVGSTAPYLHDGSFDTLERVVEHYREPPPVAGTGHELTPIEISDAEAAQLVAFLRSLDGGVAAPPEWLEPPPDDFAP